MKIGPTACAVAVATATVWCWPRVGWRPRAAGVALCAGLIVYGIGAVHLPRFEAVAADVGSTLGPYTYALVAVMAFLETGAFVGLIVPGETVVIVGGVVAGQGHIDVWAVLALTWACALAGDVTSYVLGRLRGRPFLLTHGPRVHITEPGLVRVETFFARYGPATILVGRFVGLVRPIAPFLAGASHFPPRRFLVLAILGTGLWSGTFVPLGYMFWQSLDEAVTIAKEGSLAIGGAVALAILLVLGYRHLRGRGFRVPRLRVRSEEPS